ncbi:desulfoferrodoxin FeS4 iron-binding domain-containing protein [Candidatus Bathyarchaeota archaeon]|nr:desulfoferrodoxin FeS4 iron-binding domain-containing protein [Candidatus Bathyarchaeota archaeon]
MKNVTEKDQLYFCKICGNKVQVLETGVGTLVCCGEDMILLE